ncbi:MAG: hypothetical protein A2284_04105 [Deltaproteobacteria bacterium RIFOXYA12_FULL_61_11]|nr:MAG: hypothetical protein A2284_04105 [Deltaproteobacteria bacterium RIFOXYA12_FULL_61_11]
MTRKKAFGKSSGSSGSGRSSSPERPYPAPKTPPCVNGCPNGTEIRTILRTLADTERFGRTLEQSYELAWRLDAEKNPLVAVIGRVCPHPCETACNRKDHDAAVGINCLERFLGDWALEKGLALTRLTEEKSGKKIAVIGAGPAGLSCAYQLARRGHAVTVFEAFPEAGGMLRYGIPAYRLPRKVLKAEIDRIFALGIELRTTTRIGSDVSFADLQRDYDAVFVGLGAHSGKKLYVEGEDASNVITGAAFLHRVNAGEKLSIGKKVIVVGGGDSAIDAARMAKRLGADVRIMYRRTIAEMPAIEHEVREAEAEGIPIDFLATPVGIVREGDRATKIRCIKMELGEPDQSGRRRPVPIEGSDYELEIDTLIPAISQDTDYRGLETLRGDKKWLTADEFGRTSLDKVYAGGDVLDLRLVITAIAQGRKAAESIDASFRGEQPSAEAKLPIILTDNMRLHHYEKVERHERPSLPAAERWADPEVEIISGLSAEEALAEAKRCMSCGYCFDCEKCWMFCQDQAIGKPHNVGEFYVYKHNLCTGCQKCAKVCPCGFLDMR